MSEMRHSPLSVGSLLVEKRRELKVPEDLRMGTRAAEKDIAAVLRGASVGETL